MKNLQATVLITVVLVVGSASALGQVSRGLSFSLIREYGRYKFQQCRLAVTLSIPHPVNAAPKPAVASIECKSANRPALTATEELTVDEVRHLTAILENPAFWIGDIAGTDTRPDDGTFERLEIQVAGKLSILVTSGNPSFTQTGTRLDFMSAVKPIEARLMQRADGKP